MMEVNRCIGMPAIEPRNCGSGGPPARSLGRTWLGSIGILGVAISHGAPVAAFAEQTESSGPRLMLAGEFARLLTDSTNAAIHSRIGTLVLGPDGTLWATAVDALQVLLIRGDGSTAATVGRLGSGPGEFQRIAYAHRLADSLVVMDNVLNRFTVITRDPVGPGLRIARTLDRRPGEQAVLNEGRFLADLPSDRAASERRSARALVVVTRLGQPPVPLLADLLDRQPVGVAAPDGWVVYVADPTLHYVDRAPFWRANPARGVVAEVRRSFPAVAEQARFRVTMVTTQGDTQYVHTGTAEHGTVSDADYELLNRALAAKIRMHFPSDAAALAAVRATVQHVKYYPPVTDAFIDEDGRAWLRGPHRSNGTVTWRILGSRGQVLGHVVADTGLRLHTASGPTVWATTFSSDGEAVVHRLRLGRGMQTSGPRGQHPKTYGLSLPRGRQKGVPPLPTPDGGRHWHRVRSFQ